MQPLKETDTYIVVILLVLISGAPAAIGATVLIVIIVVLCPLPDHVVHCARQHLRARVRENVEMVTENVKAV